MSLDIDFVRTQFPAFSEPSLANLAFFENAGGSYTCQQVFDRMTRFYRERKVQPYGPFDASRLGGEEMDEARSRLAAIMGVSTDEVIFGPSTTQNVYVLSNAFRQFLNEGDAIVVTNQDHEANSGAWRRLADAGIEVREWKIDAESGHLDPNDLVALLDDRVKLVCFPHCSNVIGEINNVAQITEIIRNAGAFSCVDGVSYAPHGIPNVAALGADIYMFSAYKVYGPHQGLMVVRQALAEQLPNQSHYFNADVAAAKLAPCGPDHAQVAACAGMADYFDILAEHHGHKGANAAERGSIVHELMRDHEAKLLQPLLTYLAAKNSVRLLGTSDAKKRAPTVAIDVEGAPQSIAEKMAKHGIGVCASDFYAVRPLEAMNIDPTRGVLRMSFVHYTKRAEVEALMEALDQVL